MKGYDLDGVITIGVIPERDAVIITGRSFEEAPETYEYLRGKEIFNAVYFNPALFDDKTIEGAGEWKGGMIGLLKLEEFIEDDERQKEVIKRVLGEIKHSCRIKKPELPEEF